MRHRLWRALLAGTLLGALLAVGGAALPADAGSVVGSRADGTPGEAIGALLLPRDGRRLAGRTEGWRWPLAQVSITGAYDPPATRYGAGHRGVDLDAAIGSLVVAPADGVVVVATSVVDRPVVSIAHGDGLLSSLEPVDALVSVGAVVRAGDPIGVLSPTVSTSAGHCASSCLHFGVRRNGGYISPTSLIDGIARAVLLPIGSG